MTLKNLGIGTCDIYISKEDNDLSELTNITTGYVNPSMLVTNEKYLSNLAS